jgi:hypothetical protein
MSSVFFPVLFLMACLLLRAGDPIAIGREPQLFLDDFTVDRLTGVKRVLHPPDRKGLVQDEAGREFGTGGVYLGNIVYRDGRGVFHMLYRYPWDDPSVAPLHPSIGVDKAHWFRELTGYATSIDGIRWKKPRLGPATDLELGVRSCSLLLYLSWGGGAGEFPKRWPVYGGGHDVEGQ